MRFILVDEILALEPGRSIKATKYVAPDEEYFRDHFPGFPVVPGVLLTEMMAQATGKCLDVEDPARGKAMLARITLANFRSWVAPGQQLTIFGEIQTSRSNYATAKCRIEAADRTVCSAELMFSFLPPDQLSSAFRDEVLERWLALHPRAAHNTPSQATP